MHAALLLPKEQFLPRDLTLRLELGRRFDLVVSMEVAEHLDASVATQFIYELTELAPAVSCLPQSPFRTGITMSTSAGQAIGLLFSRSLAILHLTWCDHLFGETSESILGTPKTRVVCSPTSWLPGRA